MNREEFFSLLSRVYRRGLVHGGVIAVGTALVYLLIREV
jgi:hypothetical protein